MNWFNILTLIVFLPLFGFSQQRQISGRITDRQTGQPLTFANVWIEKTLIGTTTDLNGEFQIEIPTTLKGDSITIISTQMGYGSGKKVIRKNQTTGLQIQLQKSGIQLSEVVVAADKNTLSDNERSTIPAVISRQDITRLGVQNIPEILQQQPGVSLAGQAYHAAPSIRGLARKRVITMVDGEKISSERNVGAPGTFINPFEIHRIEILKGPYSTLYGSDAIGGIINIITKTYESPYYFKKTGGRLDMSFKSVNNGFNTNLAVNGKTKKINYHLHSGFRKSENYQTPGKDQVMNTFVEEKHVGGKILFKPNTKNQLTFKTYYSKGGPIGKPAYDTLTNAVHDYDDHFMAGINYKILNISRLLNKSVINITRHEHKLGAHIEKHKRETNLGDDKKIENQKDLGSVDYIAQWDLYFTFSDRLRLLAGFDGYLRSNIDVSEQKVVRNYYTGAFLMNASDTLLRKGSQNSYGIFARTDYLLARRLFIKAGARWNYFVTSTPETNNRKIHSAFSGNIGLSLQPTNKTSLKLNVGNAFRIPDIKELYVTTNTPGGLNISNPNLVPEKSLNIDMAFLYKTENSLVELGLFRNQIKDMIILDWDTTSANRTGIFKNIGQGLIYGLEFSMNQNISKQIRAFTNLTQIYGYDVNAEDELMDIPPLQVNAGIHYSIKNNLHLSLSGRYSGKQDKVAQDDFTNEAFFTIDCTIHWILMENLYLNMAATNILNEKYREHYHFDWMYAPARSFNVGLNFNF